MAQIISVTIMSQPGDNQSSITPSYVGGIAVGTIRNVKPYYGTQSGVNAVINVQYSNGRSLKTHGRYLVNDSVSSVITKMNT